MPQSGTWLLKKDGFVKWRDSSDSSIFWLHGIRKLIRSVEMEGILKICSRLGYSKSFLVSSVIEELKQKKTCEKSQGLPFAYFYCARVAAEPERAMPDEILRSLLEQLASTDTTSEIKDPVVNAYKEKKNKAEGRTPQKLNLYETINIILALLETNGALIVIDGLDECDSTRRQDLLLAMQRLVREHMETNSQDNLRLALFFPFRKYQAPGQNLRLKICDIHYIRTAASYIRVTKDVNARFLVFVVIQIVISESYRNKAVLFFCLPISSNEKGRRIKTKKCNVTITNRD
jgi:hypothetical protein